MGCKIKAEQFVRQYNSSTTVIKRSRVGTIMSLEIGII